MQNEHPLYGATSMGGSDEGDDAPPVRIPQVYLDIGKLISDILVYRYVGLPEAEQLFDAIVCGLEACDVSAFDAQVIRSQLRDSAGRDDS